MTVAGNEAPGVESYRNLVYPWQCDAMGHMNTQFYAAAFDAAQFVTLGRAAPHAELVRRRLGWADVRQVIEYRQEILAGTAIVVRSRLVRLGTTSLAILHSLASEPEGTLHATCETTSVLFDLDRRKATPIEGELRDKVAALPGLETAGGE